MMFLNSKVCNELEVNFVVIRYSNYFKVTLEGLSQRTSTLFETQPRVEIAIENPL